MWKTDHGIHLRTRAPGNGPTSTFVTRGLTLGNTGVPFRTLAFEDGWGNRQTVFFGDAELWEAFRAVIAATPFADAPTHADTPSMPRMMYEVGVEGDRFHPHSETIDCAASGCVPITERP